MSPALRSAHAGPSFRASLDAKGTREIREVPYESRTMTLSLRPLIALLLSTVLLAFAVACDGGTSSRSVPLDADRIAPADWELAVSPDEYVATIRGFARRPEVAPDGSHTLSVAAGGTVELWTLDPFGTEFVERIATATVDDDGDFSIGPAPTNHWALVLSLDGYSPSSVGEGATFPGVGGADEALPVEFGVRPGLPVTGTVRDSEGAPVPDVRVRAMGLAYYEDARTDAEGRFQLTAPEDEVQLWVDDARWTRAHTPFDVRREPAGPTIEVDANSPVRGWVVDAASGERLAGAVVQSVVDARIRTRTDGDGRFELALPPGHRLAAFADGFGWRSIVAPSAGEAEIRMSPAPSFEARVLDATGAPADGVRILGVTTGLEGRVEVVQGPLTDDDGRFACSWMPPPPRGSERPTYWFAYRRGLGRSSAVELGTDVTEVTLRGERELRGSAWRHDTGPIAGAEVRVEWGHEDLPDEYAAVARVPTASVSRVLDDGTFVLRGVPLDRGVTVGVEAWGVALYEEVAAGGSPEPIEFRFPEGQTLSGTVKNVEGAPVRAHGVVRAELLTKGDKRLAVRRSTPLEEDGSFYFADLPPGPYQLLAEFDGYDRSGLVVAAGLSDVEFVLTRPASLVVRAGLPTGTAAEDAPDEIFATLIPVERGESVPNREAMQRDERGWFVKFPSIREGVYRVEIEGGYWRGEIAEYDLADGMSGRLDVELRRTEGARFEVVHADGTPAGGELLVMSPATPDAGRRPVHARADAAGRVLVTGLAPGEWRVRILAVGTPALDTTVDVRAGDSETRRLTLPEAGSIALTVMNADGSPASRAVVRIRDADDRDVYFEVTPDEPRRSATRLDQEGRRTLRALPVGKVTVSVDRDDGMVTREVEILPARQVDVRIE